MGKDEEKVEEIDEVVEDNIKEEPESIQKPKPKKPRTEKQQKAFEKLAEANKKRWEAKRLAKEEKLVELHGKKKALEV